jgi:hypothetical protein
MRAHSWADYADQVLAEIFVRGQPAPTREQIRDAYPFGTREYWPYKVWGKRVRAWKLAHSLGLSSPDGRSHLRRAPLGKRDPETIDAFSQVRT